MTIIGEILAKRRNERAMRTPHASYSQCGEDLIAAYLLNSCGVARGSYLDIGAHHPTYLNNTYALYQKGWRGFNIDPLADNIAAFDRERPEDTNIAAGIGDVTGTRDFYRIDPPTLSTFQKSVADTYVGLGHKIAQVTPVPFLSAADLAARYKIPRNVDLFSIDIEGGELAVIGNLVAAGIRPKLMICETIDYQPNHRTSVKNAALIDGIRAHGYFVYAETFINTLFVDQAFWDAGRG